MWAELSSITFTLVGFAYMRRSSIRRLAKAKKLGEESIDGPQAQLHRSVKRELCADRAEAALSAWRAAKSNMTTPVDTLRIVAQAFLKADPDRLVLEIAEHIEAHEVLRHERTVTAVLDVLARSGHVAIMEEFAALAQRPDGLRICPSSQMYEVLLGGHAAVGDEPRVRDLLAEASAASIKISPRAYALTIKGFLKNGMVDAAATQTSGMQSAGFFVPSMAVTQLFRSACECGRGVEIFQNICPAVQISSSAVVLILEDAFKRNDLKFARQVEKMARDAKVTLLLGAYESLLKLCTINADLYALELFEEMQRGGIRVSKGLCVCLLNLCAESKFVRFAEVIANFVRGKDGMTVGVYSSLMKCYAWCGMYDKACDLYDEIRAAGLEPDSMMYGCLMKFSVECGRTELSRELSDKVPSLDLQNYMSLIRAAGRDKDVAQAFSLLEKLETLGMSVDIATYNCVLDACVSAGDLQRARALLEQMKKVFGSLDTIAYNTLLKGYCTLGDITGAKALLEEMANLGFPPNGISFNCIINAAVSKGDFHEAWHTVDLMENNGVPVDHYTVTIMLKSLKRIKNMRYANKALDLLDRAGIDVCSDEVLLKTVLDVCIRHNKLQRLDEILQAFSTSSLRPGAQIYGLLITSCSRLKRVDHCWDIWHVMIDRHGTQPNESVLVSMLDALVANGKLEDAVDLFKKCKEVVTPSTEMYSTLIVGFADSRQADRAIEMWHDMRDHGITMSNGVYNSLIDAQARVGAMDQVSKLVEDMVSNGYQLDATTYATIVKGYSVKGDLDNAVEVFREMQANSMASNCRIYDAVLDGCTRHNRMDLAESVVDDMEKYDIKPSNVTLGILVKMYGRKHELDKAFEVLDVQAQKHGIRPNLQVKRWLMSACLYNHDFERAFKVFEELKATPPGVDAKAYGALIAAIAKNDHGRLSEAVDLVKEAYRLDGKVPSTPRVDTEVPPPSDMKVSPATLDKNEERSLHEALEAAPGVEAEALEQLLRTLATQGMLESTGLPLMEQLRATGVHISSRFYT